VPHDDSHNTTTRRQTILVMPLKYIIYGSYHGRRTRAPAADGSQRATSTLLTRGFDYHDYNIRYIKSTLCWTYYNVSLLLILWMNM